LRAPIDIASTANQPLGSFPTVDPLTLLMHNWTVVGVVGGAFESRETGIHAVDEAWIHRFEIRRRPVHPVRDIATHGLISSIPEHLQHGRQVERPLREEFVKTSVTHFIVHAVVHG
jgi:hypothetical protein